ncbi:MAG: aconitate hydratase [Bacillota bacterium]
MGEGLLAKLLRDHLVEGKLEPGEEVALRIDQTLLQDATGTMACLEFEALGVPRVKAALSVIYIDHNMLQTGYENADDHLFLQTFAAKHGIYLSRAGNGICHQVHLERFAVPGQSLLGADSHTTTAGGMGMLAIGAGGLDVALAMAGLPFWVRVPAVVNVRLKGRLPPWVSAKDVALELLRRLTVKGGVGRALEFTGPGVETLSVPERATIANMCTELGATAAVFPSDARTLEFLRLQGREGDWRPLAADPDATYAETLEIDLSTLEPLVAQPHQPDRVIPVREVAGLRLDQVIIGSCTNSSYLDLMRVATVLKGRSVASGVSVALAPGSRQVLHALISNGALADLVAAGVRILECACGPCVGMGQAPPSGGVSLRTFNRNFKGRSGTPDARVYLASPEVAAASALTGFLTDPRELGDQPRVSLPERLALDDTMLLPPAADQGSVEVRRGPNIKPLPRAGALPRDLRGTVLLKVGDDITTDDIMPAGPRVLPLRSNIPAISEYVFSRLDAGFAARARAAGGGIVVGGSNYGQGSSREHAALGPMYLGVRAVVAKSFARIHAANLVNFGILPLEFAEAAAYERVEPGEELVIEDVGRQLRSGREVVARNRSRGETVVLRHSLSARQIDVLLAGGLLNYAARRPAGM